MNGSAKLVLIVEDEPGIAEVLRDYLRQSGYRAECIGNGAEAVAAVRL